MIQDPGGARSDRIRLMAVRMTWIMSTGIELEADQVPQIQIPRGRHIPPPVKLRPLLSATAPNSPLAKVQFKGV